jgi:phosphotransferase system enzyme I (PtsP)
MPVTSRRLLQRLRALLAGRGGADARLGELVQLVAQEMVCEVCSVYAMRPGEILELLATEGLRAEAVGRTRLRVGEGIVGTAAAIAAPLNLADAQNHPAFAYRAELGEEPFSSMLCVPARRGGAVLGVLVVQNREPRHYAEEEVETLETVAMLLAEMLAAESNAVDQPVALGAALSRHFEAAALSPGIALGPIHVHGLVSAPLRLLADDPAAEHTRLDQAIEAMRAGLDQLLATPGLAGGDSREVLETYRLIAADAGWLGKLHEAVAGGLAAEAAVARVMADTGRRMRGLADAYLRERLADFEDLGNRLLATLCGGETRQLPAGYLLAARRLGPAELLEHHARGIAGLILEEGTATAHATIVARALDIPMLGGARGALAAIQPGETAVLDADEGRLILRPEGEIEAGYRAAIAVRAERRAGLAAFRLKPARSRDGERVQVMINAGMTIDLAARDAVGADGIGLFRTEIAFLARGGLPDLEAETQLYSRVLDAAAARPVLFRTLDAGGDKLLPGLEEAAAENPAMGWRSIRLSLDRPALFRRQLRALLRAGRGRALSVMFPMIATVEEFIAARRMLLDEAARQDRAGPDRSGPDQLAIGAMLEVPALLWQLDRLLDEADFVSIGSNDLAQFLFAADRGSPALSGRYDFLSAPMLDLLAQVAQAAKARGKTVGLCGEAASRPLEALTVAAMGIASISMSPAAVPGVKAALESTDLAALRAYLRTLRRSESAGGSMRAAIAAWARDHNVPY